MKTITHEQLREKLAALKSATPIAFTAITKVEAKKKGEVIEYGSELVASEGGVSPTRNPKIIENPWQTIMKLAKVQAFTGNPFQSAVRKQEERENQSPTFVAGDRPWGENVSPALIQKGDSFYLATQILHSSEPIYMEKTNAGLKILNTDSVKPFLPAPAYRFKQQLEKPVVRKDYSLESIVSISMGGEKYRVRY